MKKLVLIAVLIPFIIVIIGIIFANSVSDQSAERQPIEDEETANALISIVQNYRKDMAEAVGSGGFGKIEHYLVKNHTYSNVRAYMNQFRSYPDSEMEILEQTIEGVSYYTENDIKIYCVDVHEKVRVVLRGEEKMEDLSLRYELIQHEGEFKIESIIQREK